MYVLFEEPGWCGFVGVEGGGGNCQCGFGFGSGEASWCRYFERDLLLIRWDCLGGDGAGAEAKGAVVAGWIADFTALLAGMVHD
jgi:hypothetical protein